jgi:NADPH2:quinone reductase
MKAFVIDHYDHPSKQALSKNAPEPNASNLKKDEVLVDVYSAALNFFDVCTPLYLGNQTLSVMCIIDPSSPGQIPKPASLPRTSSKLFPPSLLRLHPHLDTPIFTHSYSPSYFQFVLGSEFSGRISAHSPIPKGCPYKPGDRVFGSGQGAFGERVAANWNLLVPMPEGLGWDAAAGEALFDF